MTGGIVRWGFDFQIGKGGETTGGLDDAIGGGGIEFVANVFAESVVGGWVNEEEDVLIAGDGA